MHLPVQSRFQTVEKWFIPYNRKHGAEGHDFDQQFGFHALVIINETFIGVFVYFGCILFIVGEVQHSPFKGIAFVGNMQPDGFLIIGSADQGIQVNGGREDFFGRADTLNAGNIQDFQFHFVPAGLFQGKKAEFVIFNGVFQTRGNIVVMNPGSGR